jgi:hypothetical protein
MGKVSPIVTPPARAVIDMRTRRPFVPPGEPAWRFLLELAFLSFLGALSLWFYFAISGA